MINVLNTWRDNINRFRWRNGLLFDRDLSNIQPVYEEILSFFPIGDFFEPIRKEFWFANLMTDLKYYPIVYEIAELLKYHRSENLELNYPLKNKLGTIEYQHLRERLFELYIRYIFNDIVVTDQTQTSYANSSGHQKPIDVLIAIDDETYNIEVTKYYDPFYEGLAEISFQVREYLNLRNSKMDVRLDQIFSGYVGFKKENLSDIGIIKNSLEKTIKSHLNSFLSSSKTIKPVEKISSANYEFSIKPSYFFQSEAEIETIARDYPFFISIISTPNFQTNTVDFKLKGNLAIDTKRQNELLIKKIKEKIKQHKDYHGRKLIVIGIDNIHTIDSKGLLPAIKKSHVDVKRISPHLPPETVVLIIFRNCISRVRYEGLIVGNSEYHKPLFQKIKHLKLHVTYTGS